MPTVYIDGQSYQTEAGKNMLQVILDNKISLEYFCWHPAMGSVGACRQCAVKSFKDEQDTKGKIVMACMTPGIEGTRISINDPEAKEFRRFVIEWLMINHPHDCPVCDEGGECHLQDMTVLSGHVYRRYQGKKRTYCNQYLGPFVDHEMNRCIQCYRCVRFYRDHAGGRDLDVYASKNHVYFGREQDGVLESEFSGNLVEVCPTGVFTDKTLGRHYTRKWDFENAPSICVHCGLGCNTIPGARYGELRRIRSRYNSDVNGYFICDRGRYGYEFVNHERRIRACSYQRDGERSDISWDTAIERTRDILQNAKGVIGIGSPRASLETNYALQALVGDGAFSTGLSAADAESAALALKILREGTARTPSLAEVQDADAILVLGADPTNEAPMLDFAIRQAITIKSRLDVTRKMKISDWDARAVFTALQGTQGQFFVLAPWRIKLEDIALESHHANYAELARLAREMAAKVRSSEKSDDISSHIVESLQGASRPLIVTSISAGQEVLKAAAHLAWSLKDAGKECMLSIIFPEANTFGVAMLDGMSAEEALSQVESGEVDTLIVTENDLSRRVHAELLERAMLKIKNLIVLDSIATPTTDLANLVIPASTYVESDGTFVNNEARAQRFYQVFIPCGELKSSWEIVRSIRPSLGWDTFEDVLNDLAKEKPDLSQVLDAAPPSSWRSSAGLKIARQSHRYTGRTAKDADKSVFEPRPPDDPQTPFVFSMEGDQKPVPGPLVQRFWWPGWNSMQAVTKFQIEVNGPLHGGNSGKRLIEPCEPGDDKDSSRLTTINSDKSITSRPNGEGDVWIVPTPRIFGSEELSRFAEGIAQLIPIADISINPDLGAQLNISDGENVTFSVAGRKISLPCRLNDSLPMNVATIPANFDDTIGILEPVRSKLEKSP